ncbi:hypothetical protein Theam_1757 (plasmid) [Thermovibrio ammonificans HB-1]|uniref:Uncharacterized protein n=1 Tax=Thermovibrio ammonificans (strain DSM 15698 / JCM 12110 / HB-1) TaxID=648996 RepID=E8T6Z2_THEA1|nr:hypothetical protein [Thermovibrio ammonificans]ADU97713.1 hypothetical protein Theam_1757 [Thermovibrio ammonificans HB-1]
MHDEEARRIAIEENLEYKKPRNKEEKRFLRIVAHFDDLLFKESLLGEPIREGEKSATLPLKFKLQGEGIFVAFFFHITSLAALLFFLIIEFWVKYSPDSMRVEKLLFESPAYKIVVTVATAAILSAVPVMFIKRYIIYPEGYLFVRVKNFLMGYWLGLTVLLLLSIVRMVIVSLKGEGVMSWLLPRVYDFIQSHFEVFHIGIVAGAVLLFSLGLGLMFLTRKDYINAVGLMLTTAGSILGILAVLLYKYGATPENAQWLIYYLAVFIMNAFSEKIEMATLLIPLLTVFLFKWKVRSLRRKMYEMPYS